MMRMALDSNISSTRISSRTPPRANARAADTRSLAERRHSHPGPGRILARGSAAPSRRARRSRETSRTLPKNISDSSNKRRCAGGSRKDLPSSWPSVLGCRHLCRGRIRGRNHAAHRRQDGSRLENLIFVNPFAAKNAAIVDAAIHVSECVARRRPLTAEDGRAPSGTHMR